MWKRKWQCNSRQVLRNPKHSYTYWEKINRSLYFIAWGEIRGSSFIFLPTKGPLLVLAAAAKSLQSCPTLWDPTDGRPAGSAVPGILRARTLEWAAIAFSSLSPYWAWEEGRGEPILLPLSLHWSINNRYTDDTTLTAESEEELNSLLMKVREESEKVGLKLNIQKSEFMASGPITSWQIDG